MRKRKSKRMETHPIIYKHPSNLQMYKTIREQCKPIFMDEHEHNIAKETGITIKQRIQTIQTVQHILTEYMPHNSSWVDQTTYNAVNYIDMMINVFIHTKQWECIYNSCNKQDLFDFYMHHLTDVIQKHIYTI